LDGTHPYVLTSRIIGTRLGLRLMAVFLWLLIGGNLFGPLGLVFISLSC
jgi:predicted PurR-regulated permease PerM